MTEQQPDFQQQGLIPISQARRDWERTHTNEDLTENQLYRLEQGFPLISDDQICEWCKGEIKVMIQRGTGVCSQSCAYYASKILFSTKEKAEKFGGGFSGA